LFEREVRRLHGFRTFQRPAAISEALGLIGVKDIWPRLAAKLGRASTDVQGELDLIVDRRNRIAHEGDIDPSAGFALKYPIDLPTVRDALVFLDTMVNELHALVVGDTRVEASRRA
jgi:hypothetical protein